jgi:hypothetical protein
MDLEDAGSRARFLIRDRDGKFPGLFDAVLKDAGIETVLSGVQMPRMNAVMERWVLTCRRELPGRTLIWNQQHLIHALREFEQFLQPAPAAPGHRERPATARTALTHPLDGRRRSPPYTETRPPRRHPPRVPACRLTCADEIVGKHKVPARFRRKILVRVDGAGASHELVKHLLSLSSTRRSVLFSCGWMITAADEEAIRQVPAGVSGRASFELVQKAILAGIPLLAAASAPSSLAVDLAEQADLTLVGFLRGPSMNVYTGARRLSA